VQATAKNAVTADAEGIANIPATTTALSAAKLGAKAALLAGEYGYGPPPGEIGLNLTFKVTGKGSVELVKPESETKGYPSYAAYSYTTNGPVKELLRKDENKTEDLTKPMTPVP
jgi:hypothetical protein